jgi:hypothetical protein
VRALLIAIAALAAGCTTGADVEKPLSAGERAALLASLPGEDREAFELLIWARDVDSRPIRARFETCTAQQIADGSDALLGPVLADQALDACFPIIEPLVRGLAMRVPALATGPTGADLNNWADLQANEQREALRASLTTRIEAARAGEAEK